MVGIAAPHIWYGQANDYDGDRVRKAEAAAKSAEEKQASWADSVRA